MPLFSLVWPLFLFSYKFVNVLCASYICLTLTNEAMYNQTFIDDLKAQKDILLDQIEHLDAIIAFSSLNPSQFNGSIPNGRKLIATGEKMPYNKNDKYQVKIAGILKRYNRFLSINEMANIINAFEPKISIEEAKSSLGSAKSLLLKDGAIVKHQVGTNNSNTFYGSPSWKDENGNILSEHMYNEEIVQQKSKITI
jgi:hypothetical protein